MQFYLKHYWNTGVAFGELTSTLIFTFLLFTLSAIVKKHLSNKVRFFIMPLIFSVVAFISVFAGWGVGNNIEMGSGKSFLTPVSALISSIYNSSYNALGYIIGFQAIGTLIGALLYVAIIYVLKHTNKKYKYQDAFEEEKNSLRIYSIKETIAQLLFIGSLVFIVTWAPIGKTVITESDQIIEMASLMVAMGVISLVFISIGNFYFSPLLILVSWLFKKPSRNDIYKFLIGLSIHIGLAVGLGFLQQHLGKVNRIL